MTDAATPGRSPLKIVLWVAAGLVGLCCVVCGIASYLVRDEIAFTFRFAQFVQALQSEFGPGTTLAIRAEAGKSVLAVGIPGFAADQAADCQDRLWRRFTEAFADGAPPFDEFAVGEPRAQGGVGGEQVRWSPEHAIAVRELAERTGIPVPPPAELPEGFRVQVGGGNGPDDDAPPEEDPAEEPPPPEERGGK
jgi:hypothetical protein